MKKLVKENLNEDRNIKMSALNVVMSHLSAINDLVQEIDEETLEDYLNEIAKHTDFVRIVIDMGKGNLNQEISNPDKIYSSL